MDTVGHLRIMFALSTKGLISSLQDTASVAYLPKALISISYSLFPNHYLQLPFSHCMGWNATCFSWTFGCVFFSSSPYNEELSAWSLWLFLLSGHHEVFDIYVRKLLQCWKILSCHRQRDQKECKNSLLVMYAMKETSCWTWAVITSTHFGISRQQWGFLWGKDISSCILEQDYCSEGN